MTANSIRVAVGRRAIKRIVTTCRTICGYWVGICGCEVGVEIATRRRRDRAGVTFNFLLWDKDAGLDSLFRADAIIYGLVEVGFEAAGWLAINCYCSTVEEGLVRNVYILLDAMNGMKIAYASTNDLWHTDEIKKIMSGKDMPK